MQGMDKNFRKPLAYSYVALAFGLSLFTLYLCYAIQWRGPFRDLWEFIGLIQDQLSGHWDFNALIEPYGGIHRIFFPKLLFYLDYRFASGSNFLSMSVTIILHITVCALFLRHVVTLPNSNREDRLWLAATTLLFWFSTTQIYNLIYISDNQVVIGNSLSIFSAALFCLYLQHKKTITLVAMNLLIVLACLSHGSSLMIWPAIIVVMFLSRQPVKTILAQAGMAAIFFGLYVSGHDPLDPSSAHLSLGQKSTIALYNTATHLVGILRYIGLHLGSPTSREFPNLAIVISYLSILYVMHIAYRVYKKKWQLNHSEILWITLACYGIFIAVITAYGRQIYPNSALTDRYQTLVMTYWAAWMALLYVDIKQHKPALVFIMPIFSLLLLLPYQYRNAEDMAWLSSRVTIAHTAAIVGITDIDSVAATLSHPLLMNKKNLVARYNDFFRDNKLAYFSEEAAQYFLNGQDNTIFPQDIEINQPCSGGNLEIQQLHTETDNNLPGERLKFTADISTHQQTTPEYLLVMDSQRKIVGLGRQHRLKGELLPPAFRHEETQQWIGFIYSHGEIAYPLTFLAKSTEGYCKLFTETTLQM